MSRAYLMAALLMSTATPGLAARDDFIIVTQASSQPGETEGVFVFVGEQLAYDPLDKSCGEDCWVFDQWHRARYRVAEWIHGVPPGPEISFDVAEHSVRIPFGHSRYALVFVERIGDAFALVKYQQVPVYPSADGSFASCGPLWGVPEGSAGPADLPGPPLREIEFLPPLVVDDSRRMSALGRATAHDPRWHEVHGDQVRCRRGIPVAELVPAIVRDHDLLKAALPALAGDAQ